VRLAGVRGALCALPAHGEDLLPQGVLSALTPVDSLPSKDTLNDVFATPQLALDNLQSLALNRNIDLGIQLRAIGSLPSYCPPEPQPCGPGSAVHDTLIAFITSQQLVPHTPQDTLRLRAAIEALGATRSRLRADVDTLIPLLDDASRDVRTAAVRALLNICNMDAIAPLSRSYASERVAQVKAEISAAIQDLHRCSK
jgi:hypothetical protein